MTDMLRQLGRASWRGIEFPVTARDYGFAQEQARVRLIYQDGQLVESLGRENPTYSYTIPFREDFAIAPWAGAHLFVKVYPDFLEACRDRSPDILGDPVHGARRCKCVRLSEIIDVNRRDGIDCQAEFVDAPEQSDLGQPLGSQVATLQGAKDGAAAFDQDAARVDWQQEEPPEATLDPFAFVSSIGDQLDANFGKFSAALTNMASKAERAVDSIDRLKDPKLAPLRQSARRLQAAALRASDVLELRRERPIRVHTVTQEIGLASLAALLGNSVRDFVRLNPMLARSPLVPAGTAVRYYGPS